MRHLSVLPATSRSASLIHHLQRRWLPTVPASPSYKRPPAKPTTAAAAASSASSAAQKRMAPTPPPLYSSPSSATGPPKSPESPASPSPSAPPPPPSSSPSPQPPPALRDSTRFAGDAERYRGASNLRLGREVRRILAQPVQPEDLEIEPDRGWLYLSEAKYLEILADAFGESWRLEPVTPPLQSPSGRVHYRSYALYVDGRFVSEAIGDVAAAVVETSGDGGAAEIERRCRYAAMVRCCKDLGVATELWDPAVVNKLRAQHFVRPIGKKWMKKG
ncbi:mitochondrial genome maintenance MGM101-domain-containing protein [Zopfochytrium polystomum]|nr:mitochondrial genome maintenance MGM101-domain-containing protein [Zopfochytrium polystomum]